MARGVTTILLQRHEAVLVVVDALDKLVYVVAVGARLAWCCRATAGWCTSISSAASLDVPQDAGDLLVLLHQPADMLAVASLAHGGLRSPG